MSLAFVVFFYEVPTDRFKIWGIFILTIFFHLLTCVPQSNLATSIEDSLSFSGTSLLSICPLLYSLILYTAVVFANAGRLVKRKFEGRCGGDGGDGGGESRELLLILLLVLFCQRSGVTRQNNLTFKSSSRVFLTNRRNTHYPF